MENDGATEARVLAERALETRKLFGESVRTMRKARGLSQDDLARRMSDLGYGMHQTTVAKLESGLRPTSVDELVALGALLDVKPQDLVRVPTSQDAEHEVQKALLAVQEIKARVREINVQIAELQTRRKALGPIRSERLQAYYAARKAAGLPSRPSRGAPDGVDS